MQTAAGRGPGAALGVLAVIIVGLATWLSHRFVERQREQAALDERMAAQGV